MPTWPQQIKLLAIHLRSQGKTFGEIIEKLNMSIPKSTLSGWLKGVKMPKGYYQKIEKLNYTHLRSGKEVALLKIKREKEDLLLKLRNKNKDISRRIDIDVGKIILAILYLTEGSKRPGALMLGSSDVNIIKLFLYLLKKYYDITIDRIKCRVSYRIDQNIEDLESFWSHAINIPVENFYKTIPDPRTKGKTTLKKDYKGVCVVYILNSSRIQLELKIISEILYSGL